MMTTETRRRGEGILFLVLFALTIPLANWMIGHAGTVCPPHGPCLVPVAPGLMAPSGVLMAGIALVLRDLVQRRLGVVASSLAILAGAALSALLAPPALVIASAVAFLLSEFADLGVYTPLARRGLVLAVIASGVAGLVVDFDRVSVACVRLARLPLRAGGRQGMDGTAVDPVGGLAAPARRTPRHHAGLRLSPPSKVAQRRLPSDLPRGSS